MHFFAIVLVAPSKSTRRTTRPLFGAKEVLEKAEQLLAPCGEPEGLRDVAHSETYPESSVKTPTFAEAAETCGKWDYVVDIIDFFRDGRARSARPIGTALEQFAVPGNVP